MGKLPWQVSPGFFLWRELSAVDIWQFLMATNEPHKTGCWLTQDFEEREYSLCCKGKVSIWSSWDYLGDKGSGSEKREQGGGKDARPQVIAEHPANLEEGLASSGKAWDCSLMGTMLWLWDMSKGTQAFSLSWDTQRPIAKCWVGANMTTSYRQLRMVLSTLCFKIHPPKIVGLMKITYNN